MNDEFHLYRVAFHYGPLNDYLCGGAFTIRALSEHHAREAAAVEGWELPRFRVTSVEQVLPIRCSVVGDPLNWEF